MGSTFLAAGLFSAGYITWLLKSGALFASMLSRGKLLGFYHQAEGGEAPGVGACSLLQQDDFVFSHLRGHGLPHMIGKGVDPKLFLAEHTGKAAGLCKGVSSWHCSAPEFGIYGSSGTMGANFPVSVGYGLAAKTNKRGQVVVSCFGDGTSNRGTLHEAFLMTMNWKLPVVWVCENNGLAMYVPSNEHHPMEDIAGQRTIRAAGLGPAAGGDDSFQECALRIRLAPCSVGGHLSQYCYSEIPHGPASGRRYILRLGRLPPPCRLLRRQLYARLELRPGAALPLP